MNAPGILMKWPDEINCVVAQDSGQERWLCFTRPLKILSTEKVGEVTDVLARVEHETRLNGLYAAGFVNYEAAPAFDSVLPAKVTRGIPLIWFGIYENYVEIEFPDPGYGLPGKHRGEPDWPDWQLSVGEKEYQAALGKIKKYIQAGDTYQVNYSFRLKTHCAADNWSFFVQMVHAQNLAGQAGYCVYVNTEDWAVCSASPELFFAYRDRVLKSRPMKGTAPRGLGYADDMRAGEALLKSQKNRAENIMIVDMVRNDMGRIADIGSVQTSHILALEKYPTFWTMTTGVECRADPNLVDIFRAMFPAASITGAPKLRAMQIIDELESLPRHIYTGSAGFVTPHNSAQFNVAIRTVLIDKNTGNAEFGAGGGIVWDSETGSEYQECHTKARVLTYSQPQFDLLETLKWDRNQGYVFLQQHLTRLRNSACYFSWRIDMEKIREALTHAASDFSGLSQRVRLRVTKSGAITIESTDLADLPQPCVVKVALKPVSSRNYFLYHKTTCRNMYENAFSGLSDCDDALLWNERGELTESSRANILIETDQGWVTPPVSCGLLNGIGRQQLIARGDVAESVVDVDQLLSAKSIWLINSVRGCWRVELSG